MFGLRMKIIEEKHEELSRQYKTMLSSLRVLEKVVNRLDTQIEGIKADLFNLKNQMMEDKDDHK